MSTHWSDLPDDLFHMIYSKVTVLRDCVRFAAVCRLWRAGAIAARYMAQPVIPWLVFSWLYGDDASTRFAYRPEDSGVMRIPLPGKVLICKRVLGAHDGGWVAACGEMQLIVVNLFSGVEVTLPAKDVRTSCLDKYSDMLWKVVFSKSPTACGCVIAAITDQCGIALCRIGFPESGWTGTTTKCGTLDLNDIAFCSGRLYGLTRIKELIKFEIGVNKDGGLVVTWEHIQPISIIRDITQCVNYIVDLHGKLAMLEKAWPSQGISRRIYMMLEKVFELVEEPTTKYTHKWKEVTSLGDYALFFGEMWSKIVYVSSVGRRGVQANYVYADDMATYKYDDGDHVYPTLDESSGDVMRGIKSAGSITVPRASPGTWILPPDF